METPHVLAKRERKYLVQMMCKYIYEKTDEHLHAVMKRDKARFDAFVHKMEVHCFHDLINQYPDLRERPHFRESRVIKHEVLRAMGELEKAAQNVPVHITTLPGFSDKIKSIATLWRDMKGKGKGPATQAVQRPFQEVVPPSAAHNYKRVLHIVEAAAITFLPQAALGRGAFGHVAKVKVQMPSFPDDVYACKVITRGEDTMTPEMLAMHEATVLPFIHRGVIFSVGLCREPPMLISRYWNGGHLDHWIHVLTKDGTRPMPPDFVDCVGTTDLFQANLVHIIYGLVNILSYVHSKDYLHNDIHGRNILLHFGREVYVGLADWGRSTKYPTTKTLLPLPNDDEDTKRAFARKYRHIPPECISLTPPPYSKAQDVYCLSYQLRRLIACFPKDIQKSSFVDQLYYKLTKATKQNPLHRPTAEQLTDICRGAREVGFDIVLTSGLRPFDE